MPIQTRLTTVVTAGPRPLAHYLAGLGRGAHGTPGPIVVPVQDADTAEIDSYLGAPAADVIARCEATGGAGDLTSVVVGRMPLVDEYREAFDSPVADLANIPCGSHTARAGSIDAALFLREFTGGRSWAHLDIAGAARSAADEGENTKGGTGYGTRLLLAWLAAGKIPGDDW